MTTDILFHRSMWIPNQLICKLWNNRTSCYMDAFHTDDELFLVIHCRDFQFGLIMGDFFFRTTLALKNVIPSCSACCPHHRYTNPLVNSIRPYPLSSNQDSSFPPHLCVCCFPFRVIILSRRALWAQFSHLKIPKSGKNTEKRGVMWSNGSYIFLVTPVTG